MLSYLVSWMAVAEFFKDPVGPTLKSSIDTNMVAFALCTWSYVYWHLVLRFHKRHPSARPKSAPLLTPELGWADPFFRGKEAQS